VTVPAPGLPLPPDLVTAAQREARTGWLATLPGSVARLAWARALRAEAPFAPGGQTAWVAPARDRTGAGRALKVGWRHPEADGLQAWAGHGAVRLYVVERTADTIALLHERCRPAPTARSAAGLPAGEARRVPETASMSRLPAG